MFTGIIENTGIVKRITQQGSNLTYYIQSPLSPGFKIDQSISHDGVCLTVEAIDGDVHQVTAIDETLQKTNLASWAPGTVINIEQCMQMNGRLDGHIVQGHVDTVATCQSVTDKDGSWEFIFEFDKQFAPLIIEKGSISVNGISLTIFNISETNFSVAVIPYTYTHTNMSSIRAGSIVNLEFDMIGKYVNRIHRAQVIN